jgi:hypothetical protein
VFFVSCLGPTGGFVYAVTAAHCLDEAPDDVRLWYSDSAGRTRSLKAPRSDWTTHSSADVAVALVDPSLPIVQFPADMLADGSDATYVHAGRPVVAVGLFPIEADSFQPIARFGHMARPNIATRLAYGGDQTKHRVHVIECMAWSGQSGAPVFCFDDRIERSDDDFFRS